MELRFNPMKRNLGGERDLDHIIHAALRGSIACLEYGLRGGLIFCLAREFPTELSRILVDKAIKYHARGGVTSASIVAGAERQRPTPIPHRRNASGMFLRSARGGAQDDSAHGQTPHRRGWCRRGDQQLRPRRIGQHPCRVQRRRRCNGAAMPTSSFEICRR